VADVHVEVAGRHQPGQDGRRTLQLQRLAVVDVDVAGPDDIEGGAGRGDSDGRDSDLLDQSAELEGEVDRQGPGDHAGEGPPRCP
jgi:hypothetical protein